MNTERYKQTVRGIQLAVKVLPKSSRSEIVGWEQHRLMVRVAAVPEKGEANAELIKCMAKHLGIAKSRVELISGETSRYKRILIVGLTLQEIQAVLEVA